MTVTLAKFTAGPATVSVHWDKTDSYGWRVAVGDAVIRRNPHPYATKQAAQRAARRVGKLIVANGL